MKYATVLLLLTMFVLAGCGQKGPLYLPRNEPAQQTTPTTQAQPDQAEQAKQTTVSGAAARDQP